MKKISLLLLMGLLFSALSLASASNASVSPVRHGVQHRVQHHRGHKAGKHHTPRHRHYRSV